jgi:type I restriction enzyme S subunit
VPNLVDWTTVPYCEIPDERREKFLVRDGDIVVARTGATTGYAKLLRNPPLAVFASYLVRFRPKDDVCAAYLGAVVGSDEYKRFVMKNVGGAAQPNANAQVLGSYPVPIPSLPIQRRIGAILSAHDDLIENNTKRIKILEEMARSLYRDWFMNFRFPGHEKTNFINSKVGKVPEGWQWVELGAHVDMITGFPFKSDQYTDAEDDIKLLRGDNIAQGYLRWTGVKRWPQADGNEYHRYVLQPGDVVLAMDRPWIDAGLKWATIGKADLPTLLVQRVARLRGSDGIHTTLVKHIIASQPFCDYVKAITTGANVPHISGPDIKKFPFCRPTPLVQQRAVEALSAFDEMIDNCTARNQNLRATRDLLLPRLISGEIDVSSLPLEPTAS